MHVNGHTEYCALCTEHCIHKLKLYDLNYHRCELTTTTNNRTASTIIFSIKITFIIIILIFFLLLIFQSKTPSLWLCYVKAHWKNFVFGGVLKLLGDLTALVGPISITHIVEYIQINLSASSLSLMAVPSPDRIIPSKLYTFNETFNTNMSGNGVNDAIKIAPIHNYNSLPSDAAVTATTLTVHRLQSNPAHDMMSALLINENTEIYYPTWMEFIENGWIMALLVLFATLAQGTFSQASTHIVNMIGIRLRTSLQSLVYRKTALISSSCFVHDTHVNGNGNATTTINENNSNASISLDANNDIVMNGGNDDDNTSNENDDKTKINSNSNETIGRTEQTPIDAGTITNLVSEDTLNVMSFFWIAHYVWAIPLKVCIHSIRTTEATRPLPSAKSKRI